jgi:hypothetical protein
MTASALNANPTPERLSDLSNAPMRYALSDGLSDVVSSVAVCLCAGLCWFGRSRALGWPFWSVAALVSASAAFWVPLANERLRERFVYPRGGYVAFEPAFGQRTQRVLRWVIAGAILVLVGLTYWFRTERMWMVAGGLGFLGLAPFARPGKRGVVALIGILCLALEAFGFFDPASYANAFSSAAGFFAMFGLLGLVRFWRFCRRHPRAVSSHA